MTYQKLFNHMHEEHAVVLIEQEMQEIINIVNEINNNKMSKLKDTLLMMAEQKEHFKIEDKTFQIIEVKEAEQPKVKPHPNALTFDELEDGKSYLLAKIDGYMDSGNKFCTEGFYYLSTPTFEYFASEDVSSNEVIHGTDAEFIEECFTKYVHKAEQPQPDYSHLVGKWVKYVSNHQTGGFTTNKWYRVEKLDDNDGQPMFVEDSGIFDGFRKGQTEHRFDLTNPQETNPDEVKKILVPSEIGIRFGDGALSIDFAQNQSLLSRSSDDLPYRVISTNHTTPIQCELIKCERAELKKGDLAFRTDVEACKYIGALCDYCIIINEHRHAYVSCNEDVMTSGKKFYHWYKLQPIA